MRSERPRRGASPRRWDLAECWTKGPIHFQSSRQQSQATSVLGGKGDGSPRRTVVQAKALSTIGNRKDDNMTRLLAFMVVALATGLMPVLAADTSTQPPTANTTSPEASQSATVPPSGSADTSGGATEQSSSPPSAGSTMGKMGAQGSTNGGQTTPNPSSKMGAQGSTSGGQTTPNPTAPGSND